MTTDFLSSEERIEAEALQVAARNPATLVARSFITYRNECYELRRQRDALLGAAMAACREVVRSTVVERRLVDEGTEYKVKEANHA